MGQAHFNKGLCSAGNAAVALVVFVPFVCGDAWSAMAASVYVYGACTYTPSHSIMVMQAAQCKHAPQTLHWPKKVHVMCRTLLLASQPLGGQLASIHPHLQQGASQCLTHTLRLRSL